MFTLCSRQTSEIQSIVFLEVPTAALKLKVCHGLCPLSFANCSEDLKLEYSKLEYSTLFSFLGR